MNNYPNRTPEEIDPQRLLSAADALLAVQAQCPDGSGLIDTSRAAVSPEQFNPSELVEAMSFLIRCGLLVPRENAAMPSKRSRGKR